MFPVAPHDTLDVAGLNERAVGVDDTFESSDAFPVKMGDAE
jgi:hypothetical protein